MENSTRPVVLLSGGVGVTPMISMLGQLRRESEDCGCTRQVWFVHAATNGSVHAFGKHLRDLASCWPCLNTHFVYSRPEKSDVQGRDYDSAGHIDIDLLKRLLPLDDYDYYFCGPATFMQSTYDDLKKLNVSDDRIHYEFFGPGKSLQDAKSGKRSDISILAGGAEAVAVRFARTDIETTWHPSNGSLLDLAEAEGLSPLYSCRSGICATCQTTVKQGGVTYASPPIAEAEAGTALICCAYPSAESGPLVLDL